MLTENICCNCRWYEGVKAVPGTAPCSKHNKQVLWNEDCDEIWLMPERLKVEKEEPIIYRTVKCSICGKEFPVPINNCCDDIIDQLICYKCVKLLAMKSLRKKFMQRVYPEGTKVLHRFKDCGTGIVLWANDKHIAVHFENGDEYAYRPENIKRLEYPLL